MMLLPPVVLPLLFCGALVGLHELFCSSSRRRKRVYRVLAHGSGQEVRSDVTRPSTVEVRDSDSGADGVSTPEDSEGPACTEDESSDSSSAAGRKCQCSASGCPLPVVAIGVLLMTVLELQPLLILQRIGWKRAFVASILYKAFWLRFVRQLSMTVVRSRCFPKCGAWGRPLELWLLALSMVRDMACSLFIFWTMSPLVGLSSLSGWICPGWSFHHLLVYRQPGHTTRENVEVLPYGSDEQTSSGLRNSNMSEMYTSDDDSSQDDGCSTNSGSPPRNAESL